jgi:hypothetical protein
MADARVRLLSGAASGLAELEKGAELAKGTAVVKGAAVGVGMTSGGRLVATSEGNRATSGGCESGAPGGAERGEDVFALFAFNPASGVSSAGALRRGSGSMASTGLTASGAGASARTGAAGGAEGPADVLLDGAEMLMLGRATIAAELWAEMAGTGLLGTGLLGTGLLGTGLLGTGLPARELFGMGPLGIALLAPGGGALTLAL